MFIRITLFITGQDHSKDLDSHALRKYITCIHFSAGNNFVSNNSRITRLVSFLLLCDKFFMVNGWFFQIHSLFYKTENQKWEWNKYFIMRETISNQRMHESAIMKESKSIMDSLPRLLIDHRCRKYLYQGRRSSPKNRGFLSSQHSTLSGVSEGSFGNFNSIFQG